jgi:hypothetical protein
MEPLARRVDRQRAGSNEADGTGQYFIDVATNHGVFQLITKHMPPGGGATLRQTNRDLRAAVNSCVSTVACDLSAPRFDRELAGVFPEATTLRLSLEHSKGLAAADVWLFFDHILETTPALVERMETITINLGSNTDCEGAATRFLSRYGPPTSAAVEASAVFL